MIVNFICMFKLFLSLNLFLLPSAHERPNILFLLADDLGWNDVGFHGSSQIDSPFIDSLANEGIILNNYYVMSLCTPSRAALLTGRHPVTTGLQYRVIGPGQRSGIPLQFRLMPEYLNDLGYESHMVGKWHLGFFHRNYTPALRGFKTFYGFYNGKNDYYVHRDHEQRNGVDWDGLDWRIDDGVTDTILDSEYGQYSTRLMADRSVGLIQDHNFEASPLFLYLALQATHVGNDDDPLQVPPETEYEIKNVWDIKRRKYVGIVKEMDNAVEKVVNSLQAKGQMDNTIIIFSSDNGGTPNGAGNNFPLRGAKGGNFEGGIRSPAFVYGKMFEKRAGEVSTELMHIADWLPTLYEAAGGDLRNMNIPESYSMLDLFTGRNSTAPRSEVLVNIDPYDNSTGIKVGRFKYLLNPGGGSLASWFAAPGPLPDSNETIVPNTTPSQVTCSEVPSGVDFSCHSKISGSDECFYDLEKDPCEFENLIDNPDYANELKMTLDRLKYWRSLSVEPIYPPVDQDSDPKNFNYVWKSWTNNPNIPPNGPISCSNKQITAKTSRDAS